MCGGDSQWGSLGQRMGHLVTVRVDGAIRGCAHAAFCASLCLRLACTRSLCGLHTRSVRALCHCVACTRSRLSSLRVTSAIILYWCAIPPHECYSRHAFHAIPHFGGRVQSSGQGRRSYDGNHCGACGRSRRLLPSSSRCLCPGPSLPLCHPSPLSLTPAPPVCVSRPSPLLTTVSALLDSQ